MIHQQQNEINGNKTHTSYIACWTIHNILTGLYPNPLMKAAPRLPTQSTSPEVLSIRQCCRARQISMSKPMKSSLPTGAGTFQPLRHRSGNMRERLHGYTKRTLGAGGSMNEAVSVCSPILCLWLSIFNCIEALLFSTR